MASTITDVSKSAGCSPATVSRVLNNNGSVSSRTREAVLKSARELGYSNGAAARDRRRSISSRVSGRTVEVILHWNESVERIAVEKDGVKVGPLEDFQGDSYFTSNYRLSSSFHRELLNGVIGELKRWDIKAVVQITGDLSSPEFIKELNEPNKFGVILLGEASDAVKGLCDNCSHPLVLVDILHKSWPDVVTIDNIGGIGEAVEHLASLGHKDLGFVGWDKDPSFRERHIGFQVKMLELGLRYRPEWCCESTEHIEEKTAEVFRLLQGPTRPTALVCCNDYHALAAIRAATRAGLQVPQDLSVVGFDDIELAQYISPALTTIRVPIAKLGCAAVQQLIVANEAFRSGDASCQTGCDVRVRAKLVQRESTAKLNS